MPIAISNSTNVKPHRIFIGEKDCSHQMDKVVETQCSNNNYPLPPTARNCMYGHLCSSMLS